MENIFQVSMKYSRKYEKIPKNIKLLHSFLKTISTSVESELNTTERLNSCTPFYAFNSKIYIQIYYKKRTFYFNYYLLRRKIIKLG